MSHFYHEHGCISIDGNIGSEMPGPDNHSSATIAAYWPGSGKYLSGIERRVGTVQYYVQHTIQFHNEGSTETEKLEPFFLCTVETDQSQLQATLANLLLYAQILTSYLVDILRNPPIL